MKLPPQSKLYRVGGCVRDALLGLPVADRDWVVVGATPEAMRAAGFKPVGADFPVFLHPTTKEEYALARTERKSGRGYKGFTFYAAPNVTIEQDLARRDLTINAIAQDDHGNLIDPFHGQEDIAARVFRHVGEAFAEDPLRVLRLARFAARFSDFTVCQDTVLLARSLRGELSALTAERVWQELARGLVEGAPHRMFEVLAQCDAWSVLAPSIPTAQLGPVGTLLATLPRQIPPRFATLLLACESDAQAGILCQQWKVPRECAELAMIARRCLDAVQQYVALCPTQKVDFFIQTDAFRRSQRFIEALHIACSWIGQIDLHATILHDWQAANAIDAGGIAVNLTGDSIKEAVRNARIHAVNRRVRSPD